MNLNTTAPTNPSPSLGFSATPTAAPSELIVVGRKASLSSGVVASLLPPTAASSAAVQCIVDAMLSSVQDSGKASSFLPLSSNDSEGKAIKLTLVVPPPAEKITRNNHPFSPHFVSDSLEGLRATALEKSVQIYVVDDTIEEHAGPISVAIARSLPRYNSKSSKTTDSEDATNDTTDEGAAKGVNVTFCHPTGTPVDPASPLWTSARALSAGVRLAARLGDMPPAELDPDAYSSEVQAVADALAEDGADVAFEEAVGEELRIKGYGGIYGVGMAGRCPPRMVVVTYTPEGGTWEEHVALCGKGVIYDTGGLALKPKVGMCGMKHDMGGSAGVLGGFQAAVQLRVSQKITLILAIVENAIGPESVRNDDILTMKSGKTVEINNTDAEGRLILADCVNHASTNIGNVDIILDMATLTGAQFVTTGKKHAGILAKSKALEERVFEAGLRSGDLVYPMLYAPELLRSEFESKVADMKNSVKNRNNAQASCAGHFIESHIDESYEGDWVHVDMAGPDSKNERATGYGVALVLGLLKAL